MGEFHEITTVAAAKAYIEANKDEGCRCLVCGRNQKVYPRSLDHTMSRCLIALVRRYQNERRWYSVRESWYPKGAHGDLGKLTWWGLVVEKAKDKADLKQKPGSKTSGFWRPTESGRLFALKRMTLPAKSMVYLNVFQRFEGDQVDIVHCLGKYFDYEELMGIKP